MTGVFLFPPLAEPCEKEGWLLRTIYHYFDKLLGYVTYTAAAVSGLAILLTAFMICYEIIARSVFGSPTVWVMEISTYFLIFAGFLGMAYTMRKNGHICVDFLYARFPEMSDAYWISSPRRFHSLPCTSASLNRRTTC